MSWLSSVKKTVKHWGEEIGDVAKDVGRVSAKGIMYAAPFAGSLFLGPLGGLAGTGLSMLAGQVGPNKNASKALKRNLFSGLAVTGGFMGLGALSGSGLGASGISSVLNLFGGGAPQPQSPPAKNVPLQSAVKNQVYNPWLGMYQPAGVATKGDPNAAAAGINQARAGGIASIIGNAMGPSGVERSGIQNSGLGNLLNGILTPGQQQGTGLQGSNLGAILPIAGIGLAAYLLLKKG